MKKKSTKSKVTVPYSLLVYVVDSVLTMKKFKNMEQMGKFVEKFHKKHPNHLDSCSGHWIDFIVENVQGPVHFFTDGIDLK